jgi:hypothetical protein
MKSIKVLGMALLGMSIIMASCSGEDGKDGLPGGKGDPGTNGTNGDPGADGLACWDTDKDGEQDPGEDINQDGSFDALDCAGNDGADGQDGSDKPNVDFYFQDGFKGYSGTHDAGIVESDPDNNYNGTNMTLLYQSIGSFNRHGVVRFNGIESLTSDLVESGETCANGFYINQATLYIYLSSYTKTGLGLDQPAVQLYCGFYNGGSDDPVFEETDVTWNMANANDAWFVAGGVSALFGYGLTTALDDYIVPVQFNEPVDGSGTVGWLAIPLPRTLVEQWVCNPESNKGMRIRMNDSEINSNSISLNFESSESDNVDLRPLLVIETEDIDPAAGKMAPSSKTKDWENMSYEEKMAPLYRYFAAKGL